MVRLGLLLLVVLSGTDASDQLYHAFTVTIIPQVMPQHKVVLVVLRWLSRPLKQTFQRPFGGLYEAFKGF